MRFLVLFALVGLSVCDHAVNPTFFYSGGQTQKGSDSGSSEAVVKSYSNGHVFAPAPAVSYASSGYAAPAVSYAAPAASYAAPAVSYAAPAVSYAAPAVRTEVASVAAAPSYGYTEVTHSPQYFRYFSSAPSYNYVPYVSPTYYHTAAARFTPINYGVGYTGYRANTVIAKPTVHEMSSEVKELSGATTRQAHEAALEAHRRAVEEHKAAVSVASSRLDAAVASLGGYKEAVVVKSGAETKSSEEKPIAVVSSYSAPVVSTYSAPVVSTYSAPVVSYSAPAPVVKAAPVSYSVPVFQYSAPVLRYSAPAVVQNYGYAKAAKYEELTREQAEYLHRDAIAKQNEIIAKHQSLIAAQRSGYAASSGGSYERVEDQQQLFRDSARLNDDLAREQAELAAQQGQVAQQVAFARAQGEAARADGDVQYPSDSKEYSGVVLSKSAGYGYVPAYQPADLSGHTAAILRQQEFSAQQQAIIAARAQSINLPSFTQVYKSSGSGERVVAIPQAPYTGPKVTAEETYALHRDAINKQNSIIQQHEALIAQQKSGVSYGSSGESSSPTVKYAVPVSYAPAVSAYTYSAPVLRYSAPAVSTFTYGVPLAKKVEAVYTGPKVTAEETYALHRDAIEKQKSIIQQHEATIALQKSGIVVSGGSDEKQTYVAAAPAVRYAAPAISGYSYAAPVATYAAPVAAYAAPVVSYSAPSVASFSYSAPSTRTYVGYSGPQVTREQTYALHKEAIDKQNQIISLQKAAIDAASASSGEKFQAAPYTGPKVTAEETYALHKDAIEKQNQFISLQKATIAQQKSAAPASYEVPAVVIAKYAGPQVTREQTYALHKEAIDKQNEIIAQQSSFLAHQNAAIQQQREFTQNFKTADKSNENTYAGGYAKSTAFVSVSQPEVKYTVSSPGYAVSSYYADDQAREQALLAQQNAEVAAQTAFARSQGAAAEAQSGEKSTAYVKSASYVAPAAVSTATYSTSSSPYFYYRYANPTFSGSYYRTQPLVYVDNVSKGY